MKYIAITVLSLFVLSASCVDISNKSEFIVYFSEYNIKYSASFIGLVTIFL